jgi:hypothetical protein
MNMKYYLTLYTDTNQSKGSTHVLLFYIWQSHQDLEQWAQHTLKWVCNGPYPAFDCYA